MTDTLPASHDLLMRIADALERRLGRGKGIAPAREFERQRHVLERRHGGNEVKALEDDA